MKYIIIILVVAGLTYYLSPTKIKEVEKIVYKDRVINQIETKIKYKDGSEKIVVQTQTVEKEKEVEKIIEKIIKKERSIYILPAIDLSGDKLIGVGFSNKLFFNFDFFIAANYNLNHMSRSNIQLGLKYNF